jgi:hypothetical protein
VLGVGGGAVAVERGGPGRGGHGGDDAVADRRGDGPRRGGAVGVLGGEEALLDPARGGGGVEEADEPLLGGRVERPVGPGDQEVGRGVDELGRRPAAEQAPERARGRPGRAGHAVGAGVAGRAEQGGLGVELRRLVDREDRRAEARERVRGRLGADAGGAGTLAVREHGEAAPVDQRLQDLRIAVADAQRRDLTGHGVLESTAKDTTVPG